jgi:predicted 2-oxoglutarate/Fe(II)-dependent dioxygenase YbiX/peroxiredoxin
MTIAAREIPALNASLRHLAYVQLRPGDLLPRLRPRVGETERFAVDYLAGRYIVLCFFGTAADAGGRGAVEAMLRYAERLPPERAIFFGVSCDPRDEAEGCVREAPPVVRLAWDFGRAASRACGAAAEGRSAAYRRFWLVIDPTLHVLSVFPFRKEDPEHRAVFEFLDRLPPPDRYAGFEIPAPVLILPNVFDAALCRRLMDIFDEGGGTESGVARNGKVVVDKSVKRRKDVILTDPAVMQTTQSLILRRVCPEIERLFFMKITRMELYVVACYAADDAGHYNVHRDNSSPHTAHRRFAVSINLNSGFEGGEISFPEYSPRSYKAPPGWAVVFPSAILHKVSEVAAGKRYAFLPFVYDEAGRAIKEANRLERQAGAA